MKNTIATADLSARTLAALSAAEYQPDALLADIQITPELQHTLGCVASDELAERIQQAQPRRRRAATPPASAPAPKRGRGRPPAGADARVTMSLRVAPETREYLASTGNASRAVDQLVSAARRKRAK